jgi:hypothetical protein
MRRPPAEKNMAVNLTLRHGTAAEARTRALLLELMNKYDLRPFLFTTDIIIDEMAIPHSHPVLTLSAAPDSSPEHLLAIFIHEELHWFEEQHAAIRDRAVERTRDRYHEVPIERPDGSGDEWSTRLHLLVCYLEYQTLKALLGVAVAETTIRDLARHHYRWVYATVLRDEQEIGEIAREFDFLPDALRGQSGQS